VVVDEFDDQVERLVDRLRSLPVSRLSRVSEGEPSIADSAHALADLAADLEHRVRRDVPRLNDLAAGDQVAVTAHDLVGSADSAGSSEGVIEIALVATRALRDRV
jgi:hypothetical protein